MREFVDFLFAALGNALWMTPLLVLTVEAGTRLLGPLKGGVHYRIWMSAFFLALILPLLPVTRELTQSTAPEANVIALKPSALESLSLPAQVEKIAHPRALITASAAATQVQTAPDRMIRAHESANARNICCLLYGAFVLFALLRLQIGMAHTHRLVGDAEAFILSRQMDTEWRSVVAHFHLPPVDLLSSRFLDSPATLHWPQAMVILPTAMSPESEGEMRTIFAHELGHIRRLDFFANLLVEFLAALLFFHPALHWIRKRVAESRELACDELAATAVQSRSEYARNLLQLAERFRAKSILQPICALGMFEGGILERRVMNLIEKRFSFRQMAAAVIVTAVLATGVSVFCAHAGVNPLASIGHASKPQNSWPTVDQRWTGADVTESEGKPVVIFLTEDKTTSYNGQPVYLYKKVSGAEDQGGLATRYMDAKPFLGKRVRVRTMLKRGNFDSPIRLYTNVLTLQGQPYESTMCINDIDEISHDWFAVDFTIAVPQYSSAIELGLRTMGGNFQVWMTDPQVEIVPPDTPLSITASQLGPQKVARGLVSWGAPAEVDWEVKKLRAEVPPPSDIRMSVDAVHGFQGQPTFEFEYTGQTPPSFQYDRKPKTSWNVADRYIDAKPYLGKRVRVSTMIRTSGDFNSPTTLTLMTPTYDGPFETNLTHGDDYQSSTNWKNVEYVVDIPNSARSIYLVLYTGNRFKVWLTEPHVEVVGSETALSRTFLTSTAK